MGAKSLRYLALVDQEMTNQLPCLPRGVIAELLRSWGDRPLLLYDILEAGDCCGAKRMEVMFDRRNHARQSLLQPNLSKLPVKPLYDKHARRSGIWLVESGQLLCFDC